MCVYALTSSPYVSKQSCSLVNPNRGNCPQRSILHFDRLYSHFLPLAPASSLLVTPHRSSALLGMSFSFPSLPQFRKKHMASSFLLLMTPRSAHFTSQVSSKLFQTLNAWHCSLQSTLGSTHVRFKTHRIIYVHY